MKTNGNIPSMKSKPNTHKSTESECYAKSKGMYENKAKAFLFCTALSTIISLFFLVLGKTSKEQVLALLLDSSEEPGSGKRL